MFIDEITLHLKAGRGGDGVLRWRHEKGIDKGGPAGGNGGKGGDVYVRAVRDNNLLVRYKNVKVFEAENGEGGMRNSKHGREGKDLIIDLPLGSVVTNLDTEQRVELTEENQTEKILFGGRGGLGNEHFKTFTERSPKKFTLGEVGEEADFFVELEMSADVGIIGLPNAGKSSLLNALTNASAKVGDYPFTTLEPNLGALYEFVLADIPGLIEGASQGKGLGDKFLRHIKRTKALIHCISLENEDVCGAYKTIRKELEDYKGEIDEIIGQKSDENSLSEKSEVIVLTKTDTLEPKKVESLKKKLSKKTPSKIFCLSMFDDNSVKAFRDEFVKILRKGVF